MQLLLIRRQYEPYLLKQQVIAVAAQLRWAGNVQTARKAMESSYVSPSPLLELAR